MIPPSALERFRSSFLPTLTEDYISRRLALSANGNLLNDAPICDGFFPLLLPGPLMLFGHDPDPPLLDFLGVSEILNVEANTFGWQPRSTFMALLSGGQMPVFINDAASLQRLADTNFNPRLEVCLPPEAKAFLTATNRTPVKISPARWSAQRIEAGVEAGEPALLVIAQTYYHPWRAYVDGQPVRLWRANYTFQAFEIPGGSHQVKLVYQDRRFCLGGVISLATLAGCLFFYGCRRRSATGEPSKGG